MALPFFYKEDLDSLAAAVLLDEDTSKHIVQVLRMQNKAQLQLTNGRGDLFTAEITDSNRKKCVVRILKIDHLKRSTNNTTLAISLIKNNHRFEWFLEKATEIGVFQIVPLVCERTEKTAFKFDRMKNILISAMLQSQQSWLPILLEPIKLAGFVNQVGPINKYIAHCENSEAKIQLHTCQPFTDSVILIGPEGDFTIDEISIALQNNFIPVALGNTRLRTETAGVVAATLLAMAE
jgi:16S rRNA (uracil1498-N3)-methyltransferase